MSEDILQPDADDYTLHWVVVGVSAVLLGVFVWLRSQVPPIERAPAAPAAGYLADWFWIVRLPEVPVHAALTEVAQRRLHHWLDGLERAGFSPILLAPALERLSKGQRLPDNSIVLVFDPAYRHTVESMTPVLRQRRWPAVWLMPREPLRQADRRFLNPHASDALAREGLWERRIVDAPLWPAGGGKQALNQDGQALRQLNRLDVNARWTRQELVNRLLAEAPLREPSWLTSRSIGPTRWGLVERQSQIAAESAGFSLRVPIDRRSARVSWLGTRGNRDVDLRLDVHSLTGELWIWLRSDEAAGESVRVAFTNGRAVLEQESSHAVRVITASAVPGLRQPGTFSASLRLEGSRIQVNVNGIRALSWDRLDLPQSAVGLTRLIVYDKVMGGGGAERIRISAAPLDGNPT